MLILSLRYFTFLQLKIPNYCNLCCFLQKSVTKLIYECFEAARPLVVSHNQNLIKFAPFHIAIPDMVEVLLHTRIERYLLAIHAVKIGVHYQDSVIIHRSPLDLRQHTTVLQITVKVSDFVPHASLSTILVLYQHYNYLGSLLDLDLRVRSVHLGTHEYSALDTPVSPFILRNFNLILCLNILLNLIQYVVFRYLHFHEAETVLHLLLDKTFQP